MLFDTSYWKIFYLSHFKYNRGFEGPRVPQKPEYPCRAIIVVPSITNNEVFDACTKVFKTWRYQSNLDIIRDVVQRPVGPYVVWVRDTVEADSDMANRSAKVIEKDGVNTLTLKERMLLELKYHDETGKHLDVKSVTLCAGSRCPVGRVPYCCWSLGAFGVSLYGFVSRNLYFRARLAVS